MTLRDISSLRLYNQKIAASECKSIRDLITWMGAIQAQDYLMARWAIGLRTPGTSDAHILASLDKGEILRTHVLRPTWHIVPAADIRWMTELTAPNILTSMRSRHTQLGLTAALVNKSNKILEKALTGGHHATRDELIKLLEQANIKNEDNRAAHLFALAELEGLICSGAGRGNKQTFALLSERVPKAKSKKKDNALATLAHRYFQSHGPATLHDFVWWSGLSVKDAKHAIEEIRPSFHTEDINGKQYLFTDAGAIVNDAHGLHLLPAYDEFLIGYRDRSPSLSPSTKGATISINGIFYPLIVHDGQVIGIWKRTKKSNKIRVETALFMKTGSNIKRQIADAARRYGAFLGLETEISPG